MRILDLWIGIPVCFFLTYIRKLFLIFGFSKTNKTNGVKKIIFIKLSEMGAISLAYPLFTEIKRGYPDAEFFFLTFEKNKNFFKILGKIVPTENIFTIRETSLKYLIPDTIKALLKIRREKMDIAFDLEMLTRFSAILTYIAGAVKKIGFSAYTFEGLYRGNLLTHKVQYNPLQHISHSYLSLGKVALLNNKVTPEFGEAISNDEIVLPKYASNAEERVKLEKKLLNIDIFGSTLFLINPGEWNWPFNLREWPLENYIKLVKKLLEHDKNNKVLIVGSPGMSGKSEKLCSSINDQRCIDLTGKTTISELLELFLISKALIANDSGLAHFASLTPLKKFIFFGPESPQIFGPLGENTHIFFSSFPCSPCFSVFNHRNSACHNNRCLKSITSEHVFDYVIKHTS